MRMASPVRKFVLSFRLVCGLVFPILGGAITIAQTLTAPPAALSIVQGPRLVDCAPVSLSPCMSVVVTPATSAGTPAPVTLPPAAQLAGAFTLTGAEGPVTPFYASAGLGPDAAEHTNVVLLMIDISGSMNTPVAGGVSRFETAKIAIAQFLDGMQEGSDRVAIVPFESHSVIPTIRSAVFTTRKADALAQLRALPLPGAKNNTALFQAVFTGEESLGNELAVLQRGGASPNELQAHLIVMTDGKNDVTAGDDSQLLNGPLGLQQAAAQVQNSHLDTIGIGFGDRAGIDADALRRLSSPNRFFYATDAQQLLEALHVSRTAVSHAVALTWVLPEDSRIALTGRDAQFVPSMKLQDGTALTGPAIRYLMPATNAPVYDRKALPQELHALIDTHPEPSSGWSVVLVHALVYLGASAVMVLLWFWVPRLIWGERFQAAEARKQRWTSDRPGVTSASGVQVRSTGGFPAGFTPETQSANPLQRSAAQTTQLQPRGEFSRTRLSFDQK